MNKKIAKNLLTFISVLFIIGIIFAFSSKDVINPDSDLGTFISKKDFTVVLYSKNVKFSVKSYSKNGINKNYLYESSFLRTKRVELFGFENDISLCNTPTVKLKEKEIVCLTGDVGVHSQSIAFFDQDLSLLKINSGSNIYYNLTSDLPNYKIRDYNNDGYDDLDIYDRNYDGNPLVDLIIEHYSGSSDGFVFDKVDYIAVK